MSRPNTQHLSPLTIAPQAHRIPGLGTPGLMALARALAGPHPAPGTALPFAYEIPAVPARPLERMDP